MKYIIFLLAASTLLAAACKKDKVRTIDSTYKPDVNGSKFTSSTNITNPYFPVAVGKKYVYEGQTQDGLERIEEQRLTTTKTILGITCIVVNFKAYLNGKLIEEAWDWYAQDNSGNVWYFGEAVDNYNTNGSLKDHAGSWEAGVDGAQPGTIMPANPQKGMSYREEYYFNHAEDRAEITGTGLTVTIPMGTYNNCIKTRNWTELEPDLNENKYYAPGIGLVKEENVTDKEEIKLIAIQ
ncbi:MAG: hypothetical protein SFU87_11385 [Chitinophagaceae bacterium]|nr:hypothetical protein [Chitinophagaceae bacterium]